MKRYIIVCLSILFFSSCSNWLDVQPKTTVEEEEVFSREIGFKEALTGIYIKMASKDLYAKNLSYGFLDMNLRMWKLIKMNCGTRSLQRRQKVTRQRYGVRCIILSLT